MMPTNSQPSVMAIGPAGGHGDAVRRDGAGQDGNDREGDREVREAGQSAVQFLLVAELGEAFFVGAGGRVDAHGDSLDRGVL
jgi:hypothetical protein